MIVLSLFCVFALIFGALADGELLPAEDLDVSSHILLHDHPAPFEINVPSGLIAAQHNDPVIVVNQDSRDDSDVLCQNADFLIKILDIILPLLAKNVPGPTKTTYLLKILKELIRSSPETIQDDEVIFKINDLLKTLEKYDLGVDNNMLRTIGNDVEPIDGFKSKIAVKFEIPTFSNPDCTTELLGIIKVVQDSIKRLVNNPICKAKVKTAVYPEYDVNSILQNPTKHLIIHDMYPSTEIPILPIDSYPNVPDKDVYPIQSNKPKILPSEESNIPVDNIFVWPSSNRPLFIDIPSEQPHGNINELNVPDNEDSIVPMPEKKPDMPSYMPNELPIDKNMPEEYSPDYLSYTTPSPIFIDLDSKPNIEKHPEWPIEYEIDDKPNDLPVDFQPIIVPDIEDNKDVDIDQPNEVIPTNAPEYPDVYFIIPQKPKDSYHYEASPTSIPSVNGIPKFHDEDSDHIPEDDSYVPDYAKPDYNYPKELNPLYVPDKIPVYLEKPETWNQEFPDVEADTPHVNYEIPDTLPIFDNKKRKYPWFPEDQIDTWMQPDLEVETKTERPIHTNEFWPTIYEDIESQKPLNEETDSWKQKPDSQDFNPEVVDIIHPWINVDSLPSEHPDNNYNINTRPIYPGHDIYSEDYATEKLPYWPKPTTGRTKPEHTPNVNPVDEKISWPNKQLPNENVMPINPEEEIRTTPDVSEHEINVPEGDIHYPTQSEILIPGYNPIEETIDREQNRPRYEIVLPEDKYYPINDNEQPWIPEFEERPSLHPGQEHTPEVVTWRPDQPEFDISVPTENDKTYPVINQNQPEFEVEWPENYHPVITNEQPYLPEYDIIPSYPEENDLRKPDVPWTTEKPEFEIIVPNEDNEKRYPWVPVYDDDYVVQPIDQENVNIIKEEEQPELNILVPKETDKLYPFKPITDQDLQKHVVVPWTTERPEIEIVVPKDDNDKRYPWVPIYDNETPSIDEDNENIIQKDANKDLDFVINKEGDYPDKPIIEDEQPGFEIEWPEDKNSPVLDNHPSLPMYDKGPNSQPINPGQEELRKPNFPWHPDQSDTLVPKEYPWLPTDKESNLQPYYPGQPKIPEELPQPEYTQWSPNQPEFEFMVPEEIDYDKRPWNPIYTNDDEELYPKRPNDRDVIQQEVQPEIDFVVPNDKYPWLPKHTKNPSLQPIYPEEDIPTPEMVPLTPEKPEFDVFVPKKDQITKPEGEIYLEPTQPEYEVIVPDKNLPDETKTTPDWWRQIYDKIYNIQPHPGPEEQELDYIPMPENPEYEFVAPETVIKELPSDFNVVQNLPSDVAPIVLYPEIDQKTILLIKENIGVLEQKAPQLLLNRDINDYFIKIKHLINSPNLSKQDYVVIVHEYGKLFDYIKLLSIYDESLQQILLSIINRNKSIQNTEKSNVIELTYLVKRPKPLVYQPYYYVKYRLPYAAFSAKVEKLLAEKPYLKSDPTNLYKELIALSNVAETSPDLKQYGKESIVNLTYSNGTLLDAQVVKSDDKDLYGTLDVLREVNSDPTFDEAIQLIKNAKQQKNNNEDNLAQVALANGMDDLNVKLKVDNEGIDKPKLTSQQVIEEVLKEVHDLRSKNPVDDGINKNLNNPNKLDSGLPELNIEPVNQFDVQKPLIKNEGISGGSPFMLNQVPNIEAKSTPDKFLDYDYAPITSEIDEKPLLLGPKENLPDFKGNLNMQSYAPLRSEYSPNSLKKLLSATLEAENRNQNLNYPHQNLYYQNPINFYQGQYREEPNLINQYRIRGSPSMVYQEKYRSTPIMYKQKYVYKIPGTPYYPTNFNYVQ